VPILLDDPTRAALDKIVVSPTAQVRQVLRARIVAGGGGAVQSADRRQVALQHQYGAALAQSLRRPGPARSAGRAGAGRKPEIIGDVKPPSSRRL